MSQLLDSILTKFYVSFLAAISEEGTRPIYKAYLSIQVQNLYLLRLIQGHGYFTHKKECHFS